MQGLPRSQENWGARRAEDGDPTSPGPNRSLRELAEMQRLGQG